MYNYLELVNKVCRRYNEVELTSSNFASASGFYATVKDAVNNAIRDINQMHHQWPWNHTSYAETLVVGTNRYSFQSDTKVVDFDSFRIRKNTTYGNATVKLKKIDYEEYLDHLVDSEYDTEITTNGDTVPRYVAQTQERTYVIWPIPDQTYTLDYEYFALPTDLSAYDDVPSIPQAFEFAIMYGALMHMYAFRDDLEMFDRYKSLFDDAVGKLRSAYINRYDHIRDNRVAPRTGSRYVEVS